MPDVNIANTTGALLVGLIIATWLFGCLCVQTYSYFQTYTTDGAYRKALVSTLFALNAFDLALWANTMYYWLILNFTDISKQGDNNWSLDVYQFSNTFISWACQMFFAWRVWRISQSNYLITGVIIFFSCLQLGK
ncbi:hypothetical protein BD410DRAFT_526112 [Rickenella mellea]|uniref:Uncharacterized protein n=1 Tax=Rickenella mellea TaxID=50990 RepID=A0A4Y7QI79_9AGAM|nr:hypothetical protein BD410DRAFT_526112 [Rickenella mellea]